MTEFSQLTEFCQRTEFCQMTEFCHLTNDIILSFVKQNSEKCDRILSNVTEFGPHSSAEPTALPVFPTAVARVRSHNVSPTQMRFDFSKRISRMRFVCRHSANPNNVCRHSAKPNKVCRHSANHRANQNPNRGTFASVWKTNSQE